MAERFRLTNTLVDAIMRPDPELANDVERRLEAWLDNPKFQTIAVTGDATVSTDLTVSGISYLDDGSVAAPSLRFTSNDTGLYRDTVAGPASGDAVGVTSDGGFAVAFSKWSSSDTDIAGLLPGSDFGSLILGHESGHLTMALRENDASDGFNIIAGGGNWNADNTWGNVVFHAQADGRSAFGTGTVAGGRVLHVYSNGGNVPLDLWHNRENTTNSNAGLVIRLGANNSNSAGSNDYYALFRKGDGTTVGSINGTGASGVNYNTTSDERLKTSLELNPSVGSILDGLDVHRFLWDETGDEDYGVFAQQAHTVYPRAVTPGTEEDYIWSADYSKFVPLLLAEVKSLRQRVAQLEG